MSEDQKQQHDTESLILYAAENEFLKEGYAGAKTMAIAEAAGVTHAMLHYYFRTKEKLFEKIVADKMDKLGKIILGVLGNPSLPLKERLAQGVRCHFDFIAANPTLPRFIFNELYSHPERLDTFKSFITSAASQTISGLQESIDKEAAKGKCRKTDAFMLILDILSLNIFPFIAMPIVTATSELRFKDCDDFLIARKEENVRTILGKLNISEK